MIMNYNNYPKGNKQGFEIENNLEQKENNPCILEREDRKDDISAVI